MTNLFAERSYRCMKTNIFKKLVATLCAITVSISIIIPTQAIIFNEQLSQYSIQYLYSANELINSCLKKLETIRNNFYRSTIYIQDLSINKFINSSIDNLNNKLNKIYYLETKDLILLQNIVTGLNDLDISLDLLLKLTKNNINFSAINYALFNANSKLDQIYNNSNKYNINITTNETDIVSTNDDIFIKTNTSDDYNSENEEWWNAADIEIDRLINEIELKIKQKKTNIRNIYEKAKKFYAGSQSKSNCWLFTSQNIANYFLYINGQNPIQKFYTQELNCPRDIVEKEFLKRQPNQEYMLRRAETQYEMIAYLKTYGISADELYVFNTNMQNEKHKKIMKKIAYLLLIQHFSNNETPVATNVGYHWVAVAGIDINSKQAIILDPMKANPDISTLDDISNRISKMTHNGKNRIIMLFPHTGYFSYVTYSNYPGMNWTRFKSEISSITNRQ